MEKKNICINVMVAAALMVLALTHFSLAQEIKVAAGAAPSEFLFAKIEAPFERASGLQLTVTTKGGVDALRDLDAGLADMAIIALSFPDWMKLAEKEGYKVSDRNAYKHRVIGKDLIKVILHKDNPVKKLSREQLKNIFAGKIINWNEAGGRNLEIVIFGSTEMPGPQMVFQKQVMNGERYGKKIQHVKTLADVKKQVSEIPGAVGLVTVTLVDWSVSSPEMPEVGKPITAITKGAPSPSAIKLFDFIRVEGSKYLSK